MATDLGEGYAGSGCVMAEVFFFFSGMQVWPRQVEPTLPEKGFQAREGNSARTPQLPPAKREY